MRLHALPALLALLFTALASAADPAAAKLVRLHVEAPEYPAAARRFNISGIVIARLRIEADGHVSKTEIVQSPADVLSKAVIESTARWKYEPIAEPVEKIIQFPFLLTGTDEDYAFNTATRKQTAAAPSSAAALGAELTEGWCHVRLLIDGSGAITGSYVLKSSDDDFSASCKAVFSALRFAPAPAGMEGYQAETVNLFFIHVLARGEIRVSQLPGT